MEHRENLKGQSGGVQPPMHQTYGFPTGKREFVFSVMMLITGLCLCNFILFGGFNLGFALAATVGILTTGGYLLASGCKMTAYSGVLLFLSIGIVLGFARSGDGFVKFVMLCFLFVSVNLGVCLTAGQNLRKPGSVSSLLDVFRTAFRFSFGKIAPAMGGLSQALRGSGAAGRKSGAFFLGLGICVPILAIVVPLLVRADAAFDGLMKLLPEFNFRDCFVTVVLGAPLALFLYVKGVALKHNPKETTEKRQRKGLGAITVNTVLGALCLVYVVYLVSQLAYFTGAFAKILPEEYSLAEYARRGFFEMAWLCFINLNVIILSLGFVEKERVAPLSTRLLCLFIGLTTLFLVATASAKMFMYIDSYGLTRLRVLTQIVMLFLGVVTAILILWLFVPKLPYMKAILLVALLLGGATIWTDVDTQVANYNVDAYLSGKLQTVDVDYLIYLGYESFEAVHNLAEQAPDEAVRERAELWLRNYPKEEKQDFRDWNYARHKAEKYLPQK